MEKQQNIKDIAFYTELKNLAAKIAAQDETIAAQGARIEQLEALIAQLTETVNASNIIQQSEASKPNMIGDYLEIDPKIAARIIEFLESFEKNKDITGWCKAEAKSLIEYLKGDPGRFHWLFGENTEPNDSLQYLYDLAQENGYKGCRYNIPPKKPFPQLPTAINIYGITLKPDAEDYFGKTDSITFSQDVVEFLDQAEKSFLTLSKNGVISSEEWPLLNCLYEYAKTKCYGTNRTREKCLRWLEGDEDKYKKFKDQYWGKSFVEIIKIMHGIIGEAVKRYNAQMAPQQEEPKGPER